MKRPRCANEVQETVDYQNNDEQNFHTSGFHVNLITSHRAKRDFAHSSR